MNIVFKSNGVLIGETVADSGGNFSFPLIDSAEQVIKVIIRYGGYDNPYIENLIVNKKNIFIDLSLQEEEIRTDN